MGGKNTKTVIRETEKVVHVLDEEAMEKAYNDRLEAEKKKLEAENDLKRLKDDQEEATKRMEEAREEALELARQQRQEDKARHDAMMSKLEDQMKGLVAAFLEAHFEPFFAEYHQLLASENYVTKLQALKLLGALLLERENAGVMRRYTRRPGHLRLCMTLLAHPSRNVQFEAFHVFKVFVANPSWPKPICDVFLRNQARLVAFLSAFQTERTKDAQFNDEKAYLIKRVQAMTA